MIQNMNISLGRLSGFAMNVIVLVDSDFRNWSHSCLSFLLFVIFGSANIKYVKYISAKPEKSFFMLQLYIC